MHAMSTLPSQGNAHTHIQMSADPKQQQQQHQQQQGCP